MALRTLAFTIKSFFFLHIFYHISTWSSDIVTFCLILSTAQQMQQQAHTLLILMLLSLNIRKYPFFYNNLTMTKRIENKELCIENKK